MEEKDWEYWKKRVSKEFRWVTQGAKRKSRKGRAKEGIWIEIRRELEEEKGEVEEERLMIREIKWEGER